MRENYRTKYKCGKLCCQITKVLKNRRVPEGRHRGRNRDTEEMESAFFAAVLKMPL